MAASATPDPAVLRYDQAGRPVYRCERAPPTVSTPPLSYELAGCLPQD